MTIHSLELTLLTADGLPASTARAEVVREGSAEPVAGAYDAARELFIFAGLTPGWYRLRVEASGETVTRQLQVHPRPTSLTLTLPPAAGGESAVIGLIPLSPAAGAAPPAALLPEFVAQPGTISWMAAECRTSDGEIDRDRLREVRAQPAVAAAGPVVMAGERAVGVLTHRLSVQFRPEATREAIEQLFREAGLTLMEYVPGLAGTFLVEAAGSVGSEIHALAERLLAHRLVSEAVPEVHVLPELDAVEPGNYLAAGAWDRELCGVHAAWELLHDALGEELQFGRPDVFLAIIDQGIKSTGGKPDATDFQGTVSDGSSKTYQLFDFGRMVPDHDAETDWHGVGCASVSVGRAGAPEGGVPIPGIPGAAPNVRLIGLTPEVATVALFNQMLRWAAGLEPGSSLPDFPPRLPHGADVFSCSTNQGAGAPLSPAARDGLDYLTSRGRAGKGCLLFFSAANKNSNIENGRPYGAHERTHSCAATTLRGGVEVRADYSGWGRIAFCAPSSSSNSSPVHDPPTSVGVWAATLRHQGNLPSVPVFETVLSHPAAPGEEVLALERVAGITPGMHLLLRPPGAPEGEIAFVTGPADPAAGTVPVEALRHAHPAGTPVVSGVVRVARLLEAAAVGATHLHLELEGATPPSGRLLLGQPGEPFAEREEVELAELDEESGEVGVSPLTRDHPAGTEVVLGQSHHWTRFGGTSSATPLCAGIAALVLSAQPGLTWVEARDIMRRTAVKLDPLNDHPIGQWLDDRGAPSRISGRPPHFSRWYGYGRLDAAAAVREALAYTFPRDLMLRSHLGDQGEAPAQPGVESPDLWVRNQEPGVDEGALPSGYEVAGPHQNPAARGERWIYVRVRNRGTAPALDAWVRVYVAAGQLEPFPFPEAWETKNGIGNVSPQHWEPGAYFIGEAAVTGIGPGEDLTVTIPWPEELTPPDFTPDGEPWAPHLLAEISPLDGPVSGPLPHQNNNLAVRRLAQPVPPTVDFDLLDELGTPYPLPLALAPDQQELDARLELRVDSRAGVRMDTLRLTFTWVLRDEQIRTVGFYQEGGAWIASGPVPWPVALDAPEAGWEESAPGVVDLAVIHGTLRFNGTMRELRVEVHATDIAGDQAAAPWRTARIPVAVPVETVVLLDCSGSLLDSDGTAARWDQCREALGMLERLTALLTPPSYGNRFALIRVESDGTTGAERTQVVRELQPPDVGEPLASQLDPPTSGSGSPLGAGVVAGNALLQGLEGRRERLLLLVTDGAENRSPSLETIRLAEPGAELFVPSVVEDLDQGCRLYTCLAGASDAAWLAPVQACCGGGDRRSYGGALFAAGAATIKGMFLNVCSRITGAGLVGPLTGLFPIEAGVKRLILVGTTADGFRVIPPRSHTAQLDPVRSGSGFAWLTIENPAAGEWRVTGFRQSERRQVYALLHGAVDLQVRLRSASFSVGEPLVVAAEVTERGAALPGARVHLVLEVPLESPGQVLIDYVQSDNYDADYGGVDRFDDVPLRQRLLRAAEAARGYPLRRTQLTLVVPETEPGGHALTWPAATIEGLYALQLVAEGELISGHPFQRNAATSCYLAPVPDMELSRATWRREDRGPRCVTVFPRTATGDPLGPGWGDSLRLRILSAAGDEAEVLATDNLDGTYSGQAPEEWEGEPMLAGMAIAPVR